MEYKETKTLQLEQFKELAANFIHRLDGLPYWVWGEALTGKEVLPIMERSDDLSLLEKLSQSCIATISESQKKTILSDNKRKIRSRTEEILERMMKKNKLKIDFEGIVWQADEPTYLEVKVSREQNIDQGSARNFFYQPTANTKITHSARHLLAGFAVREISEKRWILVNWKLVDLWFLRVKLKPEYNADNLEIYRQEAILLKGDGNEITYRKIG